MMRDRRFHDIYLKLHRKFGPRGWWPVMPPGGGQPAYTGGPQTALQRFEVAVGAVLTQNTSWKNASKALSSMSGMKILDPVSIARIGEKRLASVIRSSGYYNQKAERLKILAAHFLAPGPVTRESLLGLKGIGPETADSIMLYAFDERTFVIDAYTKRVFSRAGILGAEARYEEIRRRFEENLPEDITLYKEYHALIVELCKRNCLRRPLCEGCPIVEDCGRIGV